MKKKYIIFLLIIIVIPILIIRIIDNYFSPKTNEYIYNQTKILVSNTFSSLINEAIMPYIDEQQLVQITYKEQNNVSNIILNTQLFNKILNKVYILMEKNFQTNMTNFFKDLEIPIGSLISKTIFAGHGHIIDIPITPIGSYKADLKTKTNEIGLNSQMFEVYLEIKVDVETIIPFNPMIHTITSSFLLFSSIIQGEVPNYYYASGSDESFPYVPNI